MRFVRFGHKGAEKPGVLDQDGRIRDISRLVSDIDGNALADGLMQKVRSADLASLPLADPSARLGVPVAGIGKVVCAGMNYRDHCEEAGFDIPDQPAIFMKATTSICGPYDDVILPDGALKGDWEVELAAVIGQEVRYVSEGEALDFVAGYTILNDVSERDFQFNHGGQWFKGKSADTFCPIGPWLVTTDEVPDPQNLNLSLDLNGKRMQVGHTSKMIFSVAFLVSHLSKYMTLRPGDVVSTGTPPGVGMGQKPPVFLKPGDSMALRIDGLGSQHSKVVGEALLSSVA